MKHVYISLLLIPAFIFVGCGENEAKTSEENLVQSKNDEMEIIFIGTYTKKEGHVNGQAEGIYSVYRNVQDGSLIMGKTVAEVTNPSFVKASKNGEYLFAVSEIGENDAESGYVYSFKINAEDSLEQISKVSTESFAPAHIELDQSGKFVFVSNYVGGVVMMYRITEEGILQKQQRIDLENPKDSHAHSVTVSKDNQHAYLADLGNDKIWIYDFDAEEGNLVAGSQPFIKLEDGAGPRHFTISSEGSFAYSINELNNSATVLRVIPDGGLEKIQEISSLPEGFSGKSFTADIHLHPSGKFLYASNRGHNSIVAFGVDGETGKLSLLGHTSTEGDFPRNFAISHDGSFLYVANQNSNNIVTFKIDEATGKLSLRGKPLEIMTPVSIEMVD